MENMRPENLTFLEREENNFRSILWKASDEKKSNSLIGGLPCVGVYLLPRKSIKTLEPGRRDAMLSRKRKKTHTPTHTSQNAFPLIVRAALKADGAAAKNT